MRDTRIYVPETLAYESIIDLPTSSAEHLVRVLRMQISQSLTVFNGDGRDHAAEIVRIDKRGVAVRITSAGVDISSESPLRITLAQGIARGEKMDWIVQKATELGVHRIVPVITERTEVKLDAGRAQRRVAHWQAVVISACEQSGRAVVPVVAPPVKLADWCARLGDDTRLLLSLDPQSTLAPRELDLAGLSATLIVGPEGGLAKNDLALLAQAGFRGMRLGPRILRTETAGIAAITALQTLFGDLE
ncbi:MAG: 16S rRNA (uracil(1498)-N(3))-methyltransferase [Dokdonella sp.]